MLKLIVPLALLLIPGAGSAVAQTCLHGSDETPAQKTRRDAAIQLATRINLAQIAFFRPGPPNRGYRPLEELANIPATPQGFELQFHTDGNTYSFDRSAINETFKKPFDVALLAERLKTLIGARKELV